MRWIGVRVFVPPGGGGCVTVAFGGREILCIVGREDDTIFAEVGEEGCVEWDNSRFESRGTVSGVC